MERNIAFQELIHQAHLADIKREVEAERLARLADPPRGPSFFQRFCGRCSRILLRLAERLQAAARPRPAPPSDLAFGWRKNHS